LQEPHSRNVTVVNAKGLHARPSAAIAELVGRYDADVFIGCNGETEEASSILGLLTLGAVPGTEVRVTGTGPEAKAAVDAVAAFIDAGFDKL